MMSKKDTFKCLENLENFQEQLTEDSESRKKASHVQRVGVLKARRDQLRRKLQALEKALKQDEAEARSVVDEESSPDVEDAEKNLGQLKLLYTCYNFVGVTCTELEGNNLLLRFSTSHKNEFKESYFLELRQTEAGLSLSKHDLPCFVPIGELTEKHLSSDHQYFFMLISDYLQAYVKRREEAELTKKILQEAPVEMNMTLPVDYIEIKISSEDTLRLKARLVYSDLLKVLPTRVNMEIVFSEEEMPLVQDQVKKWKEFLKLNTLSEAMEMIWLEMKKCIRNLDRIG